ncbi:hypothetical protein WS68_10130 [Burkholderia sp. TSV86]|nr:hypothetical protein WS68_10130 [Burkholderia sp. TSV86]
MWDFPGDEMMGMHGHARAIDAASFEPPIRPQDALAHSATPSACVRTESRSLRHAHRSIRGSDRFEKINSSR